MSGNIYTRGGIGRHVNGSTGVTTVKEWTWEGGTANSLWLRNKGAGTLTLSFNATDAAATVGITVAAAETILLPVEATSFWTRAAADNAFEAVAFVRRG